MKARKIIRMSWIKQQAKQQIESLIENPDIDNEFMKEEDITEYVKFLINAHKGDWIVYNDLEDERII